MVDIVIPREYGYVLGIAAVSALHLFSLGIKVGGARKAAGVEYPYAYAERAEAEKDRKKHIFNCVQRVHQNSLEIFPVYTTLLLIGGIKYPEISAGAGVLWLLGRIVYANGYATGDPKKRARGSFHYLGLLTLIGTAGATIYNLVKA